MIKYTLSFIVFFLISMNLSGQERFRTGTVEAYIGTMVIEECLDKSGSFIYNDTTITYQHIGTKTSKHSFLIFKLGNFLLDTWDAGEMRLNLQYLGAQGEKVKFRSRDVNGNVMTVLIDFINKKVTYIYDDELKKLVYY